MRQKKTHPILAQIGFQRRQLCAAPAALRHDSQSLVAGEPSNECHTMRSSPFACGTSAQWFAPGEVRDMIPASSPRLTLATDEA